MRYLGRVSAAAAGVLVLLVMCAPAWGHAKPPKRVLIVVLDQFRPDYVDKFDMRNVKALMRDGVSFDNAYLGHMASETVITHNVITSGQLPRDMGWADEAYRDADDVLGEGADSMWISGSLTRDQFNALIAHGGYAKLADYLHAKHPGTKFIAAGQKDYAVYSSNGPTGDISVTFSGRNFDCDGDGVNNWRGPTGLERAELPVGALLRAVLRRLRRLAVYGTATTAPAWMYPLDGNRFAPGFDPAHRGGDVWTTDAGLAMMEKEPWSGMLLTLGSIDKASHMWGGITDDRHLPAGLAGGAGAPALHREDGGRAGRAADAQAARARPARRDAGRADHRSRRPAVEALQRRQRGRPRQQQLVLRRDGERHVPGSVAVARAADRHRQRALLLPGLGDPHVADRHVRGRQAQRGEGDGEAARRDRHVPAGRPALPAREART